MANQEDQAAWKISGAEWYSTSWEVSQIIDNRFKLIRKLGPKTWTGYDLAKQILVTVVQLHHCPTGKVSDEFRQQAIMAAQLKTQNICRITGIGVDRDQAYAVAEGMQGAIPLEEELRKFGNLPEVQAVGICEQVYNPRTFSNHLISCPLHNGQLFQKYFENHSRVDSSLCACPNPICPHSAVHLACTSNSCARKS